MSDLALNWTGAAVDFAIEQNDVASDDGLETAITVSLFTDRRVDADELPPGETDRRGWWGDAVPVVEGDAVGSRLWLIAREKEGPDVAERARVYAREALEWMLVDGVAQQVDVEAEVVEPGLLGLAVTVHRPGVDPVTFRFAYNWTAQEARR